MRGVNSICCSDERNGRQEENKSREMQWKGQKRIYSGPGKKIQGTLRRT